MIAFTAAQEDLYEDYGISLLLSRLFTRVMFNFGQFANFSRDKISD